MQFVFDEYRRKKCEARYPSLSASQSAILNQMDTKATKRTNPGKDIVHPRVRAAIEHYNVVCTALPCDAELADTANFCAHYGFDLADSANTIVAMSRKTDPPRYAVCVLLATTKLDVNKTVCRLLGVKRASFAPAEVTTQATGMKIGGIVAIGVPDMPVFIDAAVMARKTVIMGGGNRVSKLTLKPSELLKLPNASVIDGLAV